MTLAAERALLADRVSLLATLADEAGDFSASVEGFFVRPVEPYWNTYLAK